MASAHDRKTAGQPVSEDRIIDGQDVSDILLGKAKAKSPHEYLYYEKDGILCLSATAGSFVEHDLEKDLGEQNDLSKQIREIQAPLAQIEVSVPRVWWRSQNLCLPIPRACPLWLNTEKIKQHASQSASCFFAFPRRLLA